MKKFIPLLIAIFSATLLSTLPHLINLIHTGDPAYFADSDDTLLYLPYSSQAYHNHPLSLSDPIKNTGFTLTPSLQLVPFILAAKVFSVPIFYLPIIWRLWAGISCGLMLYLLFQFFFLDAWLSCFATILMLSDSGEHFGNIFIRQLEASFEFARTNAAIPGFPFYMLQWRIITPGLSIACLFFFVYCVLQSVEAPKKRAYLVLSMLSFALLVQLYFYFWTAAAAALFLAFISSKANARAPYGKILVGGFILALPALYLGFHMKQVTHPDVLPRLDFFLPIAHFSQLLLPRFTILFFALAWLIFVKLRNPKLLFPLLIATSAFLLLNHQVITGLQIQNFHYMYVLGPFIYFCCVTGALLSAQKYQERPQIALVVGILAALNLSLGLFNRAVEATRTQESLTLNAAYNLAKNPLANTNLALAPQTVIAGDEMLSYFSSVRFNLRPLAGMMAGMGPEIADAEWNERVALNDFLRGKSPEEFNEEQKTITADYQWGKWARSKELQEALFNERIQDFQAIAAAPAKFLAKYEIRYILQNTAAARALPNLIPDQDFSLLLDSGSWKLWERKN